jgi:hypothetical protein
VQLLVHDAETDKPVADIGGVVVGVLGLVAAGYG